MADRFAAEMGRLFGPDFPPGLVVAASGGGDSMALLHLAAGWARPMGLWVSAVTVDHGLRADARREAALVAAEAAGLGVRHEVLDWRWDGAGNLQAQARQARLALIGGRAAAAGVPAVFGHTRDDQAETVLMRLARGSGVEGLSGMAPLRVQHGEAGPWHLARPLLGVSRAELRHHCRTLRIPFVDDPGNDDPAFERVRARTALAALADLGLGAAALAATAERMRRARRALGVRARDAANACLLRDGYDVAFDRDAFAAVERDTQMRLLAAALMWVSGAAYRPRAEALEALLDRALGGAGGTLSGAQVVVTRTALAVGREHAAVRSCRSPVGGAPWDGCWHHAGEAIVGLEVRALGPAGLRQVGPVDAPVPHALRAGLPSLWDGARLVACKALGYGPPHEEAREVQFRTSLIAH